MILSPVNSIGGPSDLSKSARNAQTSTTAVNDTLVPTESGSTFSHHKASRGDETSFTASATIAATSSSPKTPVRDQESGRMSSGIRPPSSGLELVDRLQDLEEDGDARWHLIQVSALKRVAISPSLTLLSSTCIHNISL